jgi:mitochondrial import inner membrane translocase subunit TIM44
VKPRAETPANTEAKVPEDAAESKPEPSAEEQQRPQTEDEGKSGEEKTEEKTDGADKEKKEDLPPPPPHGDKTPWQVFMETMQSEFKQSKEWEESTKALAQGAHDFTESESVQKARKAYEATSGAISSTTGKVLKNTATAVGKGATWTWETPVMKGVRKGANVTGEALDKATKPIRETEAYKNVKDVIDDGSSSRYGGWVEKEERRKRRELRAKLAQFKDGNPEAFHQEDPE